VDDPRLTRTTNATLLTLLLATALPAMLLAQDFSQTQTKPSPTAPLIQQANDALAAADLATAFRLLTTLNTQTPNNPQVLYDLGLTLEGLADSAPTNAAPQPATCNLQPATPESCYRAAIAADPAFPAPHAALGLLLARTNRAAEAHAELLAAANLPTIEPTLKAHTLRALARLNLQATPPNPTAAATELLAAIQLTPETPADTLLSAQIAEATPDPEAAEKAYRRYLNLRPNDLDATSALAHILLAAHRPAEAETLLTQALAASPDPNQQDPALAAQLARAYLASPDPAKQSLAAPLLEKLHAAHPQDPNITRLLARVYLETDHPEQAEPLYAALISSQSQTETTQAANSAPAAPDPTLLAARAEALLRLNRPGEAETLLKQAVANPAAFPTPQDFADAATTLAYAAAKIDDPRETLQALALRATVLPPSAATLFLEATANDTLHQTTRAVDLYNKFLAEAAGSLPDQESQARQRIAALNHRK
jgi:tetratricopeptide (TPR) repeat protein